jgi:osmotically inducible protein OsmC
MKKGKKYEQAHKSSLHRKSSHHGCRAGTSPSDDCRLKIKVSPPVPFTTGTNPEQRFAAGWSACFLSAIGLQARKRNITLPDERYVDAEVELCTVDEGFFLRARLQVSLPGIQASVAHELIEAAHQTCPYSKPRATTSKSHSAFSRCVLRPIFHQPNRTTLGTIRRCRPGTQTESQAKLAIGNK